ncbi:MAG: alanine--tRNA ligase [Candidatus Berkelbacteria bacterium]|nr:alanine--tRNA ligase [Candidatus Berkelbacteria bacterium]
MSSPDFSPHSLREKFLKFFEQRGHRVIPPSSLVPENDPTVLFTTAGMHPLIPYLMGEKHPEGKRLVNIQPCLRTDDIDEIGDTYHHTFFEMPGNWSLGDYWKEDAIKWSWEFLTEELKIDKNKIAISCFAGDGNAPRDDESANVWKSLGVSKKRIKFLGKKDNWWGPAGQTGPCGPDTEMFVWAGDGEPPEEFAGPEDIRWVEVWNDVFMEHDKQADGTFKELNQKNVDTGMGFERMLAVLNGADDDYKTELFWPIIQKIEEISGKKYGERSDQEYIDTGDQCWVNTRRSFRIIADHIKAAVFILTEGITPSNKLQGYVLRRLIRRAVVKGQNLGMKDDFTSKLASAVIEIYKDRFPRLKKAQMVIGAGLEEEEVKFRKTLDEGLKQFEKKLGGFGSAAFGRAAFGAGGVKKTIDGQKLFDLYQTYGFPLELSLELAKEKGTPLSEKYQDEFNKEFEKHQEISRAGIGAFRGGLADAKEETTKLHTAAHLLHSALRKVLGEHVLQKGSNITAERLRFDFSHPDKSTEEQIKKVEDLVNEQIQKNLPVEMEEMSVDEAKKSGALGVFDERYGNKVKVYTIGNFSKEICGGPHAKSTGELGTFKITNEMSSSAGIRRIKAVLE